MRAFFMTMCALGLGAATLVAQSDAAKPATDDSKATVYVYRYKQYVGSGLEPSVYCDDKELARMDNGRFFLVQVPAGKHTFRSNDKQASIDLDTKPGQKYFIRVEIASGFMKGHGRVVLMTPEQGESEIKKLKPLDDSDVRDHDQVVAAL